MMMMAARERGPLADLLAKKKIQAEAIAAGYRITCLQCGAQWAPTLRGDRRLPTGYWRCPNGCNVPAPSPAASATAEPAPMIDLASLPALLTTDEVAAVLRLHPTTVKLLMRDGKLPGRKIGGQWRLLKSDLLAYLGADFTGQAEAGRASTGRPVNAEADR